MKTIKILKITGQGWSQIVFYHKNLQFKNTEQKRPQWIIPVAKTKTKRTTTTTTKHFYNVLQTL